MVFDVDIQARNTFLFVSCVGKLVVISELAIRLLLGYFAPVQLFNWTRHSPWLAPFIANMGDETEEVRWTGYSESANL